MQGFNIGVFRTWIPIQYTHNKRLLFESGLCVGTQLHKCGFYSRVALIQDFTVGINGHLAKEGVWGNCDTGLVTLNFVFGRVRANPAWLDLVSRLTETSCMRWAGFSTLEYGLPNSMQRRRTSQCSKYGQQVCRNTQHRVYRNTQHGLHDTQ